MTTQPLMPKATAVWLVDNTALTFKQIADFVGMHELEVAGIADGAVATGIKGMDPIAAGQLDRKEIERCEQDSGAALKLRSAFIAKEAPRKGPRYTPLSKRQDKPAAIAWLVRNHPELVDAQIAKLIGTTKTTIQSIRNKTHWNMANIKPIDPVALGLCSQSELDSAVAKAAKDRPQAVLVETRPEEALTPVGDILGDGDSDANAAAPEFLSAPAPEEKTDADVSLNPDDLFSLPADRESGADEAGKADDGQDSDGDGDGAIGHDDDGAPDDQKTAKPGDL